MGATTESGLIKKASLFAVFVTSSGFIVLLSLFLSVFSLLLALF